ncbi:hypothetical protein H4Q32_030119 [Labeo rohita]|uniref:DDE Tnp4 domain-containing protein n=1 Tax=Labeo rohita TaxID=84645 RepID=A0ABQ8MDZ1_LABRO|nr:hypothetical protein H4Q32_030119 [Labeo rohita]
MVLSVPHLLPCYNGSPFAQDINESSVRGARGRLVTGLRSAVVGGFHTFPGLIAAIGGKSLGSYTYIHSGVTLPGDRRRFGVHSKAHVHSIRKWITSTISTTIGSGTFHRETGDLCGVGESTVCKIVHKVCSAICELKKHFIKFPNAAEQATYKVDFYEYGNFPGVIGCIDGCHIPIKCPSTADAEEFRNRKNWFSINVQGVCTPTMQFSNIVARWKGSTHDSRIFHNSSLYVRPEQQRYNQAHMLTRGLIERMFGCGCPHPDIEDDDDQHVPIAELANDRNGLAYRDAFALQHFS